ncbi:MAG: hypothetical protein JNG84_00845, partial [Archangium sp.]|nr:hypothetical protein [Archangium sp.]
MTLLTTSSCGGLDCVPRTVAPTGDLRTDVLGAWDQFGVDSRVIRSFHADGGVTTYEPPNLLAPGGTASTGA